MANTQRIPLIKRFSQLFSRHRTTNTTPIANPTTVPSAPPQTTTGQKGFLGLDRFTKNFQDSIKKPTTQNQNAGKQGPLTKGVMALGAIGGIAESAGSQMEQSDTREHRTYEQSSEGVYSQEKGKVSDQGFIESRIDPTDISRARDRAWHFFQWSSIFPELYAFHSLDENTPRFQSFLSQHPEIPRDILELKQTWEQYWAQFPEGMKSEQEKFSQEQVVQPVKKDVPSLIDLAVLPGIAAIYAKESLDPKRQHETRAMKLSQEWRKQNPDKQFPGQMFIHNDDGSMTVNHKLFDQIPSLLELEKKRQFAYKDISFDPLIKHISLSTAKETESHVKTQGLHMGKDTSTILKIKNDILEKKYDQFLIEHPKLAQAYKTSPHIQEAMKRAGLPQASPNISSQAKPIRILSRMRQPLSGSPINQLLQAPQQQRRGLSAFLNRRAPTKRTTPLLPSLPGPFNLLNPAQNPMILILIVLSGALIMLLFTDINPSDIQQASDDKVGSEAGCKTGPDAQNGTGVGDPECTPSTQTNSSLNTVSPFAYFLHFSFPKLHAFAQESTTGNATDGSASIGSDNNVTTGSIDSGFNPVTDVVHRIHIFYGKPSKDIVVTYPIPSQVQLLSSSPPPTDRPFRVGDKVDSVSWSVKKILNPSKSDIELKSMTLSSVDMTFKLTLRPNPGVNNTYIISQAIIALDPLTGGQQPGGNGPTTTVDTSGGNTTPNTSTCGGNITINNPDGTNFGDPSCAFSVDKLSALLKQEDPENADYWFSVVIPCESPGYDPNLYYRSGAAGDTPDAAGAWGLFQMGRGLNGQYDHGDVSWTQQVINAVTYRKQLGDYGWHYWACAESRW